MGRLEEIVARLLKGSVYAKVTFASGRVEFYDVHAYCDLPTAALLGAKVELVEVPQ